MTAPSSPAATTPLHPAISFIVRRRTAFFIIAPLLLIPAKPVPTLYFIGVALALLGQAIRIWAAGTIHKSREVTTGGPYAYVRHPLYFGSFFLSLAYCFMSGLWWSFALLMPLYLLLHGAAVASEERKLSQKFGDAYRDYARHVGRVFPRLRRPEALASRGSFGWSQVRENNEHITILFTLSLTILFGLRMVGGG
jgi:protein-S-isoprenylcysteine O-methyltransferase Ste14